MTESQRQFGQVEFDIFFCEHDLKTGIETEPHDISRWKKGKINLFGKSVEQVATTKEIKD
jgi:hypothetical protein